MKYYWIPIEYKYEFLQLALTTSVIRSQPLSVPPFFENHVADLRVDNPEGWEAASRTVRLLVVFKKKIPNDSGTMRFTYLDKEHELSVFQFRNQDGNGPAFSEKVDRLWIRFALLDVNEEEVEQTEVPMEGFPEGKVTIAELRSVLRNRKIQIELSNHRPTLPSTEDLIRAIKADVGSIRLELSSP